MYNGNMSKLIETFHRRKSILVLTTGGTIEKSYDEGSGVFENRENFLTEIIKARLRMPYSDLRLQTLMNKDSLYMTEDDRALIFAALMDWSDRVDGIVVLHGTDTMDQTASYCLEQNTKTPMKKALPIIFTGSMRPFGFEQSDATQNMTESLLACKILGPGFYISFHNQIFCVPRVRKNKDKRTFEWT